MNWTIASKDGREIFHATTQANAEDLERRYNAIFGRMECRAVPRIEAVYLAHCTAKPER